LCIFYQKKDADTCFDFSVLNAYNYFMFIVIEGIDGAGCETQAKNLYQMCKDKSRLVPTLIKYPDYEKNIGKLINEFLYQNKDLTAEQQFLLYTMQFIFDKKWLTEKRKQGLVISDRYFTTTLCYQTLEGIKLDVALKFATDFKIEKPDVVFYLDVDPNIAIQRKSGEAKEKNRREKDFEFIHRTHQQYDQLVKNQVWTKWVRIDGNKTIDEITKDIYNRIINYK